MKTTLKRIINSINVYDDWLNNYKHYVPLFISEASKSKNWDQWDKDVFEEYIKTNNCVSSLQQGHFTRNEIENIKANWQDIAPILKTISDSTTLCLDQYQLFEEKIDSLTKRHHNASKHRLIASLQPNLLCTIVADSHLKKLFDFLNTTVEDNLPQYTGNWYIDSNAILSLIKAQKPDVDFMDLATYAWQIKECKNEVMEKINYYKDLLLRNKNLILTGAPGTGKTYLANLIANDLGANVENGQCKMVQFHPSYDYTDFVEGLRPIQKDGDSNIGFELKRGVFKDFCAQALENLIDSKKSCQDINEDVMFKNAYDDMIDKIRNEEIKEIPLKSSTMSMEIVDVSDNNNLILKAKGNDSKKTYIVSFNRLRKLSLVYKNIEALDSIHNIYKAVTDAIKGCHTSAYWATLYFLYKNFIHHNEIEEKRVERKNFVFIIDEINRGEISKIFGELFFSIDPGYRGKTGRIQTQYQNLIEDGDVYEDGFYVPENVYIIGTMNDIDRSVDSMDFAMRRRFAWKEIKATDRIEMLDELSDLKNKAIEKMVNLNMVIEKTEGLNSSYHIDPAYFRKVMLYKDNTDTMWSYLWDYHIKGVLYEYLRGTEDINIKMAAFEKAYNNK